MRTTVLVPLHSSAGWERVVAANLTRLAPHARIIVSDATGLDDTLDRLRDRFRDPDGIEWVGPREVAPGWVPHCNDLLTRATTDYVMWLPHDDDVDADWVVLGEDALDASPGAALALGQVRTLERDASGNEDRTLPSFSVVDPHPPFCTDGPSGRVVDALDVCLHGMQSLLGVAFRGVFRRATAVPLPDTGEGGPWADILWAVAMLTVGRFAPTEAVYWKRLYDGNTHGTWRDPRRDPAFRSETLAGTLAGLPDDVREQVLLAAWARDADRLTARIETLEQDADRFTARIETLEQDSARLRRRLRRVREARAELERSTPPRRATRGVLRRAQLWR